MKTKPKTTDKIAQQAADALDIQLKNYSTLLVEEFGPKYVSLGMFAMKTAMATALANAMEKGMNPGKAVAVTLRLCAAADRISDELTGCNKNERN